MADMTLLTSEQLFGDSKLEVFEKYGTRCGITDFARILGGYVNSVNVTIEECHLKNCTCQYWTKTDDGYNSALVVASWGKFSPCSVKQYDICIRPVIPYLDLSSISSNIMEGPNGTKIIEYGQYPKWIVSKNMARKLELIYSVGLLRKTGSTYTTNSSNHKGQFNPSEFVPKTHIEYKYKDKKYIRLIGDKRSKGKMLADRRIGEENKVYWLEVEPVLWLVDEKSKLLISKEAILSGIQFNRINNYKGDFEKVDLKMYMDNFLYKDLFQNNVKINNHELKNKLNENDSNTKGRMIKRTYDCQSNKTLNNQMVKEKRKIKTR